MTIDVLYFAGCPSFKPTVERIQELLREENVAGQIRSFEVSSLKLQGGGFLGSPTVLVNGVDIESYAQSDVSVGLCCRIYAGKGVPSFDLIRRALRDATKVPKEP